MSCLDTTALKPNQLCRGARAEVDPEAFKGAMSSFPSGVTVVTALDSDETLCGLTANAFSSVSIDPPLILVCLNYSARCYRAIRQTRRFGVHILTSDQERIAQGFARRGGDRSAICPWTTTKHDVPVLEHFHTAVECEVYEDYPGGDHSILVGRVLEIHRREKQSPLVYYGGSLFPLDR